MTFLDGRTLPRPPRRPEWVKEVRHVRVVTLDTDGIIHRNPHCNQRGEPSRLVIMWRRQIVEIPPNGEWFTVHRPAGICPSCRNWWADWLDWREQAACRTAFVDDFFPDADGYGDMGDISPPLEYCRRCPVATHCLRTALRNQLSSRSDFGIWGGTDRGARGRLRGILAAYTAGEEETMIELVTISEPMNQIVEAIRRDKTIRVRVDPISKVRTIIDADYNKYDSRSFAALERRNLLEHVGYDHGFQLWTLAKRLRIPDDDEYE